MMGSFFPHLSQVSDFCWQGMSLLHIEIYTVIDRCPDHSGCREVTCPPHVSGICFRRCSL